MSSDPSAEAPSSEEPAASLAYGCRLLTACAPCPSSWNANASDALPHDRSEETAGSLLPPLSLFAACRDPPRRFETYACLPPPSGSGDASPSYVAHRPCARSAGEETRRILTMELVCLVAGLAALFVVRRERATTDSAFERRRRHAPRPMARKYSDAEVVAEGLGVSRSKEAGGGLETVLSGDEGEEGGDGGEIELRALLSEMKEARRASVDPSPIRSRGTRNSSPESLHEQEESVVR